MPVEPELLMFRSHASNNFSVIARSHLLTAGVKLPSIFAAVITVPPQGDL